MSVPMTRPDPTEPLLEVAGLRVDYTDGAGGATRILSDIDLTLAEGESLALVGESGCGKTTLALAMINALPKLGRIAAGSVHFRRADGTRLELSRLRPQQLARFHWVEAAVVFQGAMNALNPLLRIRAQFTDTVRAHRPASSVREIEALATEALELVELPPGRVLGAYPHELSGGMKQRVLIALALVLRPRLLIMDEPTTALDVLTQRAIIDTLQRLRHDLGFAVVFVTHDLGLASELADQVATMYAGRVVEQGSVAEVFGRPRHPYTAGLIRAIPRLHGDRSAESSIPGSPPGFARLPSGCPFRPRCARADEQCAENVPPLTDLEPGHAAACFHPEPVRLGPTKDSES